MPPDRNSARSSRKSTTRTSACGTTPATSFITPTRKINPVEDAAAVDGLVTGWCVKDYRYPRQVDLTPGTGLVDFRAVFARLKKGGFNGGPLVIETLKLGDLPQLLAEAKKARRFVETLIAS